MIATTPAIPANYCRVSVLKVENGTGGPREREWSSIRPLARDRQYHATTAETAARLWYDQTDQVGGVQPDPPVVVTLRLETPAGKAHVFTVELQWKLLTKAARRFGK